MKDWRLEVLFTALVWVHCFVLFHISILNLAYRDWIKHYKENA